MDTAETTAREPLFAAIDAREEETIDLVGRLVRFPSTLGKERPAQEFITAHLRDSGLEADVWEIDEAVTG